MKERGWVETRSGRHPVSGFLHAQRYPTHPHRDGRHWGTAVNRWFFDPRSPFYLWVGSSVDGLTVANRYCDQCVRRICGGRVFRLGWYSAGSDGHVSPSSTAWCGYLVRGHRLSGWFLVPRPPALRSPCQPPRVTPLQRLEATTATILGARASRAATVHAASAIPWRVTLPIPYGWCLTLPTCPCSRPTTGATPLGSYPIARPHRTRPRTP